MDCSISLIALAAGYLVFQSASRELGSSRTAGRVIGLLIIVGAVLSMMCAAKCMKGSCGLMGKSAAMCPISKAKLADAPAVPVQ